MACLTMQRVVVLTGAGISAESGLRTFRGSDGFWDSGEPSPDESGTALVLSC